MEEKNEIWKDIKELNFLYQVSNKGRFRRKSRYVKSSIQKTNKRKLSPMILTQNNNGKGYLQISVQIENKRTIKYAHRLIAKVFIPNPNNHPEVNHINGIKQTIGLKI